MKMKKYELAERLAERMGCTNEHAYNFLTALKDTLLDLFAEGQKVAIRGIGTFYITHKKGYWRSFFGKEQMWCDAKNRLAFRPHEEVTNIIN